MKSFLIQVEIEQKKRRKQEATGLSGHSGLLNMTLSSQELFVNLRKITTVDWAYKAANVLERIFWASIGIIGISWGVYFITMQVGSDIEIMIIQYEFNH